MSIRNQKGLITVDYLFAMVLVMGFSFVLFALSLTLTVTEVVQYMTYSSARNYFAASLDEESQQEAAFVKFQSLRSEPAIAPLLNGAWFEIDDLTIGTDLPNIKPQLSEYQQQPSQNMFHGAVVFFTSKVLDFSIPFYGSTADDDLRGQEQFGAYIGSYLGREVTQKECEQGFLRQRWDFIKNLPTNGNAAYSNATTGDDNYVGIADNGC